MGQSSETESKAALLGGTLRQMRRAARISQSEVAARAGCSSHTLRKVEQGERGPSVKELRGYADALDMSLEALLDRLGVQGPRTLAEIAACSAAAERDPGSITLISKLLLEAGEQPPDVETLALARYWLWLGEVAVTASTVAPAATPTAGRRDALPQWEYTVLFFEQPLPHKLGGFMGRLNDLGAAGWELVGVLPTTGARGALLFKRPTSQAAGQPM